MTPKTESPVLQFDEGLETERGFLPLGLAFQRLQRRGTASMVASPQVPCQPRYLYLNWYADADSGERIIRPVGMKVIDFMVGQNRLSMADGSVPFEAFAFASGDLVPIVAPALSVGSRVALEVVNDTPHPVTIRATFWSLTAPPKLRFEGHESTCAIYSRFGSACDCGSQRATGAPLARNPFARHIQETLRELGFSLGRCGADGLIGPDTIRGFDSMVAQFRARSEAPADLQPLIEAEREAHARTQASLRQLERSMRRDSEPFEPGDVWETPTDES